MAIEILMPKLGLTMTEGTIETWLVNEGDYVDQGDPIVEISSEKLTNEVEASESGTLIKIVAQEGDVIPKSGVMAYIGEEGETIDSVVQTEETGTEEKNDNGADDSEPDEQSQPSKESVKKRESGERIFITPVARKMAEEKGIDVQDVNGTGGNGRITRLDIERYVPIEKSAAQTTQETTVDYGVGLEGMRKTIAERMMRSVQSSAQVTNQRKIDITELMIFREEMKEKVNEPFTQGELSINTLLTKAVVMSLLDTPEMNAWYHAGEYIKVDDIHIGMATAIDDGLVVPVIENAHQMSLSQLGPSIRKVTSEAQKGTLDGSLYSGSTFSITNLGGYEIEYFTPIINTPEVGILGVGAIQKEIELDDNGEVIQKRKLPLSLTYDHQIIDGAPAAEFLSKIADYLQDPYRLLI